MNKVLSIILIVLLVVVAILGLLYFLSSRMQSRQLEQQKLMEANTQSASIFVIDKKKMRLKDAPLPKNALDGTPAYAKFMKVGVVSAKIGPKILNLLTDASVYESLPVKASCTVKISGLYITAILKGAAPSEKELQRRTKANAKSAAKAEKEAAKKKASAERYAKEAAKSKKKG